ncbi:MAG TPA: DUF2723 domain-containing protein [Polyangia bacterium]|nr:DUF2723 domain-containing protein [Polyangia bacterium]
MTRPRGAGSLWLPLQDRLFVWGAAALLLIYCCATLARDLSPYDSAELALAAYQGGLGHPPGQPLHTMIGWLCSHVPGVRPLVALSLLSAVPAALTLLPVASLAEGLCERPAAPRVAAITVLGVHAALWEPATRVEIYSLATLLALWAAARLFARAPGFLATGLALGLAAAVNPVIAALVALSSVPALVGERVSGRALAHLAGGGVLGLLPYLYVPLIARRDAAVFVWGAPRGGAALVRFLRAADFSQNAGVSVGTWVRHLGEWTAWSARQGILPLVLVGLFGHLWLGRRAAGRAPGCAPGPGLGRVFAPLLTMLTLGFLALNVVWRLDNPDYLGYLAAPLFVLVAGAGGAVAAIAARGARFRVYGWLLTIVLAADAVLAPPALFARTRGHDRAMRLLAEGALGAAPTGALVVVASDHWVFPLLWLQEAEAQRPDVVIVPYGLASSSWYWEHLFRRHPDLERIELRAPGGTVGRVRRLLSAHPARAVLVERFALAAELGLIVCADGWLLRADAACAEPGPLDDAPTRLLAAALAEVGAGSPASDGVLTQVAFDRGEALWRLGHGAAALEAFLAGVPARERPAPTALDQAALERVPPLRGRLSAWQRQSALGDPARNLLLAGLLLRAAGDTAGAERHFRAAAMLGLPEAQSR